MSKEQTDSVTETVKKKFLRPALVASEKTFHEYRIFLKYLLVGLADESIPVALVCPPDCDVDSVASGAVEVMSHPFFKLHVLWRQSRKKLIERLERFKPSVVHCLCESQAALTRQLARQLDLPYVLSVNSLRKERGPLPISQKRCAKILVPAKTIAADIAGAYPRFAERVEQINIGAFVGESRGCFSEDDRLPSMVTAYPLDSAAEFENLFGALRHLAIDGYEFMFAVIGGGRAERQLRTLLDALGLLQIVTMVPRLEPRRSVLAAGDIFIQPQPSLAFNPILLEAMSVGTAVAGCKGGVDDLIIEGRTAVVFDPDDELSIYGSLQQLFDKREWARQLATGAQEYLRENHTVSNMVSSILEIYRNAQQPCKR